jgi:hypothetical protein
MEAFRYYEIAVELPAGRMAAQFVEMAGVLQPVTVAGGLPLIDEWKIDDDISGAQIRLALHGDIQAKRLTPPNSDPANRLVRLFASLAYIRLGMVAHGLEKMHFFRYADGLETSIAADLLTAPERGNAFMEAFLGSWRDLALPQLSSLAAVAGIDPQATDEELRRTIREWYANATAWSTRMVGFSHQAANFLRIENGVEQSKVAKGDECRLVREPYNPADANAILVVHRSGRKMGYVRRTIAEHVAPLMDRGVVFRSKVCAFLPDEFPTDSRVYLSVERLG